MKIDYKNLRVASYPMKLVEVKSEVKMYRLTKQQKQEQGIISSKKVKNNTRLTIYANGDKVLRLHSTDIITWIGNKIILNSGGWRTTTTKSRMNEFLPKDIKIFQKEGDWYVEYKGDYVVRFNDGIQLVLKLNKNNALENYFNKIDVPQI
jgi:hypothetical protein